MKSILIFISLNLLFVNSQAGTELKLNSGLINTANSVKTFIQTQSQNTEWIVQFKKHITESDKREINKYGAEIFAYIPEDALLIRAEIGAVNKIIGLDSIQAVVAFAPEMKISPNFGHLSVLTSLNRETVLVSTLSANQSSLVASKIQGLGSDILVQKVTDKNLVVTLARKYLLSVAAINGIEHVQPLAQVMPLHIDLGSNEVSLSTAGDYTDLNGYETGTKVMGFDTAWNMGLTGAGQIVGMADTGLDSGDAQSIHADFTGAVKSGYAVGMFGKSWADPMGHGTHVAGSVLGRGTASGGKLKGAAPTAQMVAQGMWSPILNNLSVPSNLAGMFNQAYNDGARIHTNSWGAAANFGAYEKMAATVDDVMFAKEDLLILFAAGNSGVDKNRDGRIDADSIGTPGTAKNALTVGASENLLFTGGIQRKIGELKPAPDNWPVAPISESKLSDNIDGVAMFSSRGPTRDGRTKPDVVAPGTNILSVKSQQSTAQLLWGAYNNDYVYSGGTSMACPLAAGGAAVIREYLITKLNQPKPTAALLKAYILHTAVDMYPGQYGEVGASRGQELLTKRPNNDEGYGRVDISNAVEIAGNNLFVVDSKGVATGKSENFKFNVKGGRLVANIVWTDAPGSANASKALVNDLDFEVTLPSGKTISANDQINNHSFVQADVTEGEVSVKVTGVNVPMGKAGLQPFALVLSVK